MEKCYDLNWFHDQIWWIFKHVHVDHTHIHNVYANTHIKSTSKKVKIPHLKTQHFWFMLPETGFLFSIQFCVHWEKFKLKILKLTNLSFCWGGVDSIWNGFLLAHFNNWSVLFLCKMLHTFGEGAILITLFCDLVTLQYRPLCWLLGSGADALSPIHNQNV